MRRHGEPELDELALAQQAPAQAPPAGAAIGAMASGVGNAAFASMLSQEPAVATPLLQRDRRPDRYKKRDNDKPKEDQDGEQEGGGLGGVLSTVENALKLVGTVQMTWDKMVKSEVSKSHTPIPPMMTDEVKFDLNGVLEYETSRLLCEFVFEKARMYKVDIKRLVDEQKGDKTSKDSKDVPDKSPSPAPEPAAKEVPDARDMAALAKDLEGLNAMAIENLKEKAGKKIAESTIARPLKSSRFWWNEEDDRGVDTPPKVWGSSIATGIRPLQWGEVVFRPRIGRLNGPAKAGMHPDVEYFRIPAGDEEVVEPVWWVGGYIQGITHGDDIFSVTIDELEAERNEDKPLGLYRLHATFDWDESNTFVRFRMLALPYTEMTLAVVDGEPEGEPDVGWF